MIEAPANHAFSFPYFVNFLDQRMDDPLLHSVNGVHIWERGGQSLTQCFMITAWLRGYPQPPSEAGLELLGKLMGCARQMDMLMDNESTRRHYVDRFLAGDYEAFA